MMMLMVVVMVMLMAMVILRWTMALLDGIAGMEPEVWKA